MKNRMRIKKLSKTFVEIKIKKAINKSRKSEIQLKPNASFPNK